MSSSSTPVGMSTRSAEAGNLQKSRIGTVLISAAVIDDVIGLVLSSLIPALAKINSGNSQTSLSWTIIRPILSSVLIALVTPPVARFILRPLFRYRNLGNRWCTPRSASQPWGSAKVLAILSPRKFGGEEHHNGWGTQDHADAVALVLMVLFVSGFSSIAYCAPPDSPPPVSFLMIFFRYWKQRFVRCIRCGAHHSVPLATFRKRRRE